MAAGADDVTADKRRAFVARVAANDWDAVILTRTAFQSLNLSPDHRAAYIDRQVAELRRQLEAANEREEALAIAIALRLALEESEDAQAALILRKCYREDAVLTVPKTLRLDGGMAKRILGIGIPSAFENSLFEAGRILVVSMISTFGTVQIAANAVANNLDGMGVIPGKAISLAMITVVGRCIGAGDHEQTVYYTRKLLLWAYITMGLSNGAILLFLRQLVGIYALSGETMELAITLVTIHAGCAIIFWPLSFVLPNALRAANDVKFTMVVSILSMACWRLGFSYLLCVRMGWGAVGVWVAMVIDWTCRVTCFVLRFRSGAWKTKYQA